RSRRSTRARSPVARSVSLVALFQPWITVIVVAVAFPEPGFVVAGERQPSNPLRALPEIQMWNEEPCRPTVLGVERAVVVLVRYPGLPIGDVLEREVRRIAPVAPRGQILRLGAGALQQRVDRHSAPGGVELRPLGHAMDVHRGGLRGKLREFEPG